MSEFKPIETQEQLDAIITDRVRRAQESVRREYADYDGLKKQAESFETDRATWAKTQQELEQTIAQQRGTIARYESDALKRRIADEVGLPAAMAGRLTGEDEAALRKDAEALLPLLRTHQAPPLRDPEAKPTGDDKYRRMLAGLKGE